MRVFNLILHTPIQTLLIAIGLSLIAAVFWWFFFKQRTRQLTTKNSSILTLFIVGMVMVIPLALVESSVTDLLPRSMREILFATEGTVTPLRVGVIAFCMFFIAALLEELSKLYFLAKIMPLREIDQVIDSIKFGIAIGIGFAIVENAMFLVEPLLTHNIIAISSTFFLRFFFSTLAHAVYSGMAGYFLGLAKFEPWKKREHIAKAISLPILVHGVFNTLVLMKLGFYAIPLILILFVFMLRWYENKKNAKRFLAQ